MKPNSIRSWPSLVNLHVVLSPRHSSCDWDIKVVLLMIPRCTIKDELGNVKVLVSGPQYSGHHVCLACDSGARGLVSVHVFRSHLCLQKARLECLWTDTHLHTPCLWHSKPEVGSWPHTRKSRGCCESGLDVLIKLLSCVWEKPVAISSGLFWSQTILSY